MPASGGTPMPESGPTPLPVYRTPLPA